MCGLAVARPGGSGGVMSDAQNRRSVGPPRPPAITPQRATAALAPGRRHRHGVPLQVHRARAATDVEASLENGGGTAGFRLRRAQLRDAQAIGAISAEVRPDSPPPEVATRVGLQSDFPHCSLQSSTAGCIEACNLQLSVQPSVQPVGEALSGCSLPCSLQFLGSCMQPVFGPYRRLQCSSFAEGFSL